MKNQLLFLISIVLCTGCFYEGNFEYRSDLKKVPQELVDHFPKQITNGMAGIFVTNTDPTNDCIYYMLWEYKKHDFDKTFLDTINNKIIAKFGASDSNIVSIKRRTIANWYPEREKVYKDEVRPEKFYYPIPYFENDSTSEYRGNISDIYSATSDSGLSKDFVFYVFGYKSGVYWPGLGRQRYIPEEFKRGYSKGLAVNEKKRVIVYWFIIW